MLGWSERERQFNEGLGARKGDGLTKVTERERETFNVERESQTAKPEMMRETKYERGGMWNEKEMAKPKPKLKKLIYIIFYK